MTGRRLYLELPIEPGAPRAARAALAYLDGVASERLDDLRTVASELVTNVIRHSGLRAPETLQLTVDDREGSARIMVRDRGVGFDHDRLVGHERSAGTGGLGLLVVRRLSRRFGVDNADGVTVWADVPIDGPPAPLRIA